MAFTKAGVEELSALHREPDWLRARRLTSFRIYEGLAVPDTKRQEDWRQVDLKGLDLDAYAPFQQPNGTAPLAALEDVGGTLRPRGPPPGCSSNPSSPASRRIKTSSPRCTPPCSAAGVSSTYPTA